MLTTGMIELPFVFGLCVEAAFLLIGDDFDQETYQPEESSDSGEQVKVQFERGGDGG